MFNLAKIKSFSPRRSLHTSFLKALEKIESGELTVVTPEGGTYRFGRIGDVLKATFVMFDWGAVDRIISTGNIGFAEGYMAEEWETDHLPNLLQIFHENEKALQEYLVAGSFRQIAYGLQKAFLKKNTVRNSRRNIKKHYDLGNDFYQLWLDPSMTYSSGLFAGTNDLEIAQQNKYNRILDQLPFKEGKKILEIGCGWGSFLEQAASRGFEATGITVSRAQHSYASRRLEQKGLMDKAHVQFLDYRRVMEAYDYIVSIEMFEAVGKQYWQTYFSTVHRCLKDKGRAVIQVITIDDSIYKDYIRRTDFIQKHIFPGGVLPSLAVFRQQAEKAGLNVIDIFGFGQDYARTLQHWYDKFLQAETQIRHQGMDTAFIQKWRFYLAYCMVGFRSGRTNVYQVTLDKGKIS